MIDPQARQKAKHLLAVPCLLRLSDLRAIVHTSSTRSMEDEKDGDTEQFATKV
jgi:hypothetical protein